MGISDLRAHSGRPLRLAAILLAVVLLAVVAMRLVRRDGYQFKLVFPSAPVVVEGLVVQVDGVDAGKVTDLEAKDSQAVVTVTLEPAYDEMPEGPSPRCWAASAPTGPRSAT
jgi:phospholipid/cholesterol/gamma-HCH transport system substrate-binding protein